MVTIDTKWDDMILNLKRETQCCGMYAYLVGTGSGLLKIPSAFVDSLEWVLKSSVQAKRSSRLRVATLYIVKNKF